MSMNRLYKTIIFTFNMIQYSIKFGCQAGFKQKKNSKLGECNYHGNLTQSDMA